MEQRVNLAEYLPALLGKKNPRIPILVLRATAEEVRDALAEAGIPVPIVRGGRKASCLDDLDIAILTDIPRVQRGLTNALVNKAYDRRFEMVSIFALKGKVDASECLGPYWKRDYIVVEA